MSADTQMQVMDGLDGEVFLVREYHDLSKEADVMMLSEEEAWEIASMLTAHLGRGASSKED